MKIAFIDPLGLTYDGSTLEKRGLGGSESAVILLSKELAKIGLQVSVYNDCTSDDSNPGIYDNVTYYPLDRAKEIIYEIGNAYDVCIVSRSVKPFTENWNHVIASKHKVFWMHDTFSDGDDVLEDLIVANRIDEIFTLSDWHGSYISHCDHGKRRNFDILKNHIFQTRNGIGNMNLEWINIDKKDPNLFVFNASVTKGMVPLVKDIWPKVKMKIPEARLKVIGGYYRFRESHGPDQQELDWRKMVEEHPEIEFTGIITQKEISEILKSASYMIYPVAFPETFGISTLEAIAHNVPIITCRFGALEETAIDLVSYKLNYPVEPNWALPWLDREDQINKFVDLVVSAYSCKYTHQQKMYACNQIKDICTWDTVALQWKQHLYKKTNRYLPIEDYRKVKRIDHKVRKIFNRRFLNSEELVEVKQAPYNKIYVITPVYNAENYIENTILSVAQQDYDNWEMQIIDDCSTDNTVETVTKVVKTLPKNIQNKIFLKINKKRMGALHNQVTSARNCGSGISMLLDGDDWLINDPTIFDKYNNLYNDGVEFTYGSCWSLADNIPLIAQPYPPQIKKNKLYRQHKFNWNMPYTHLRTFSNFLLVSYLMDRGYHKFKDENLNWLKAGADTALFYELIEYADPDKVVCVPEIVCVYNDLNPLNDYKVNSEEQTTTANKVLNDGFIPGQFDLRPL